ncbi:hypothetical protein Hanom_Chr16g01423451 [Helianthus anomalus]
MMEATKGNLNPHPMHKNRATRQFFFITASSAWGRAQPTRPVPNDLQKMPSSGNWTRGRVH